MEGILHVYHSTRNLLLFEHVPRSQQSTSSEQPKPPNTLLFVGGMFDNFLHPSYTSDLSALFPRHKNQSWSVMHVQLSSAGRSFGTSSLSKDADEIALAVNYIRSTLRPSIPGNIVLLGHSTGCQDILTYLYTANSTSKPRPPVQGAILQAPASDRDGLLDAIRSSPDETSRYDQAIAFCNSTPEALHTKTIIPLNLTAVLGPAPMSISRYLSLISPSSPENPGPDDLFSEDGTPQRLKSTFGHIASIGLLKPAASSRTPTLLTLIGEHDEYVPDSIDKHALLKRWTAAMKDSGVEMDSLSVVLENATHAIEGEDLAGQKARLVDFRTRVLKYLDNVVGGIDEQAWDVIKADERSLENKSEDTSAEITDKIGGMKL